MRIELLHMNIRLLVFDGVPFLKRSGLHSLVVTLLIAWRDQASSSMWTHSLVLRKSFNQKLWLWSPDSFLRQVKAVRHVRQMVPSFWIRKLSQPIARLLL